MKSWRRRWEVRRVTDRREEGEMKGGPSLARVVYNELQEIHKSHTYVRTCRDALYTVEPFD